MALFENFPYTDLHNLNLDWIVQIAKDFLDQYTSIQQVIQTGLADLADSRETGLEELNQKTLDGLADLNQKAIDGLADLQDKYDTLEGLLQAWYDTHSADIAGQLATAIANFNTAAEAKSQALLDSWPADYSELVTEYNILKGDFDDVLRIDIPENSWLNGRILVNTGAIESSEYYRYVITELPYSIGCLRLTTGAQTPAACACFYDENNNYITDYTRDNTGDLVGTIYIDIPENAKYIGFSCWMYNLSDFKCLYIPDKSIYSVYQKYKQVFGISADALVFEEMPNKLLNTDGTIISYDGYVTSEKIPVLFGTVIEYKKRLNSCGFCFYDQNDSLILFQNSDYKAITPPGAAYMRIGCQADTLKDLDFTIKDIPIGTIAEKPLVFNNTGVDATNHWFDPSLSGYYTTWLIDLSGVQQFTCVFTGTTYNAGIAYYDKDLNYLSGDTLYKQTVVPYTILIPPTNAKYVSFGTYDEDLNQKLFVSTAPRDVYIGTGRKYTSILHAMKNEHGAVNFIIEKGTYNVVNEYMAEYGNDFWENYQGYIGYMDLFLRGYTPYPGQQMTFRPGAKVVFDYDGNNENVFVQFSVFNLTTNNILEGVRCEFGNRIARYCIHDDGAPGPGTNIIRNCTFNGTSYNGPVIGGGCGDSNEYLIEHCIFENNNGSCDVMYHNGLNAGAVNRIHVRDCIGDIGVIFLYCGLSTLVSDVIVSNSKFPVIQLSPHVVDGYPDPPPLNMRLIDFCNDKTPVT